MVSSRVQGNSKCSEHITSTTLEIEYSDIKFKESREMLRCTPLKKVVESLLEEGTETP